ncbi:MAG: hypothetical protein QHH19_01590 [Candidatus Thermoplasmatota archaeon]|jgi:hypothetical protein|nr:hypothetical protein [Candidatus Thermoplasmatota archaeon]
MKKTPLRSLIKNEKAVSEEFTSLPALSVVMIGFTLFFILIANVYSSYAMRVSSIDKYQTADLISAKLTNLDCFFIKEGGLVDLPKLKTPVGNAILNSMREQYKRSDFDFIIRVSWGAYSMDFPETLSDNLGDRVAVSKDVGIYLNEAQTVPGKLTVILWSLK